MAFPAGADTIELTGTQLFPANGDANRGQIIFTPSARLVDATNNVIYNGGTTVAVGADGSFTAELLLTDSADIEPAGWRWHVEEKPTKGSAYSYYIELTAAMGATVDLADVAEVSGPGGGAPSAGVTSVNGETGVVTLTAGDVGADAAGSAAAAQSAATTAAASDATAKVAAHEADTTSVHGIADTSLLATDADITTAVSDHAAATDPHGDRAYADGKLAKTSNLSDVSDTATARTNLGLGTAATRAVGTTAGTVAAGDDSRFGSGGPHAATHATAGSDPVSPSSIGALDATANLSDVGSAATARSNLGLGNSATRAVGTGSGDVAAGDTPAGAVTTHAGAADPHGDRAWATGQFEPLQGVVRPSRHGFKAWAFDPALSDATANPADGAIMLAAVTPVESFTATRIWWYVSTAGSGLDAGQNFIGLYNSSGTRLVSVGVDSEAAGSGAQQTTISVAVTAGSTYWVAFLFNGTTRPAMPRAGEATGGSALSNINLSAASFRFAQNGTGTSLPATITPASNVAGSSYWAAIA